MPSPFPGMDPWLEHQDFFPGVHDSFATYLHEALNASLPAPYVAGLRARIWIEMAKRPVGPDEDVVHTAEIANGNGGGNGNNGGVAVAQAVATKPVVIRVPHEEIHEGFVDILTQGRDEERVVTTIELLSLTNKTPGEHGREQYQKKQRKILESQVHLVEIDLLRGGQHTSAVPLSALTEKIGAFDYHVCIHHFDNLEDYFVYAWRLGARLPTIEVPLLPGDGAVNIDLQPLLDRCYESGLYRRKVRYRNYPPEPPLTSAQQEWAEKILEKGL